MSQDRDYARMLENGNRAAKRLAKKKLKLIPKVRLKK